MPSYRFLDFELSEGEFFLSRSGQRVALEPKALRVLTLLVRRAGHLVDKRELLESVWPNSFVEENTLTRTITILRRELGDSSRDSKIIETVPTRGYRFIAPVTSLEEENRMATPNSEALTVPTNGQNIASEPDGAVTAPRTSPRGRAAGSNGGESACQPKSFVDRGIGLPASGFLLEQRLSLYWSQSQRTSSPGAARLMRKLPKSPPSPYCL